MYLDAIRPRPGIAERDGFPFALPLIRDLEELIFEAPVTFFVGENGSGKSTLLEALAVGMKSVAVGSHDLARDPTLEHARALADTLIFSRKRRARQTMFFRAEDAFGFTSRVTREMRELRDLELEFKDKFEDGSYGQTLAMGAARGQRTGFASRYGEDPDARSHGESFLDLLIGRIHPRGLYFLDEPETPLSPARILGLISLIKDRIADDCQFVIATHSPILMAFPGADIRLFTPDGTIRPSSWDEIEHVSLTKAFLNDPENFLRRL